MSEDGQREVVEFLSRPSSHGLAAGEDVAQLRTHASIVFLAGERALKLKRSVRYAYLDYSSVERRRQCCEAELRLNRRTAPEIYEGVRAVTRAAEGGLAFDGAGEAVDWVVAMRRFPQEALFSALAARRALTPPLIRALVVHIVGFHRAAEPMPRHGGAAAFARLIEINDRSLRSAGLPRTPADDLRARSQAALARIGAALERRRAAGKVRYCHGDLHLGNVCLFAGQPRLFDGIEFSEEIACIDVLYDLAFLVMDLGHRGLAGAASAVFNQYLDASEEADGLAALPLFLSLRAAIRAHVTAAANGPAAGAEARAYLDFAQALLAPAEARLIAIGGLSGSGKSTVAAAVAPQLGRFPGARVLRSDVLRKRHLGAAPLERLPPEAYTRETSAAVYAKLLEAARETLSAGCSVVLDAVAAEPGERAAFAALAAELGRPFRGLWLEAPGAVLEARLRDRRGDASDATPEVVRKQLAYDLGPMSWPRVDAARPLDEVLRAVRRTLGVTDRSG